MTILQQQRPHKQTAPCKIQFQNHRKVNKCAHNQEHINLERCNNSKKYISNSKFLYVHVQTRWIVKKHATTKEDNEINIPQFFTSSTYPQGKRNLGV